MCRVNAFLEASNDAGKRITLGGRSRSSTINACFNTDNAGQSDCSLSVHVDVVGRCDGKERRRHGDDRASLFLVRCPDQDDQHCRVTISCNEKQSNVFLPGHVSVKAALECVEIVRLLKEGDLDSDDAGFIARLRLLTSDKLLPELATV